MDRDRSVIFVRQQYRTQEAVDCDPALMLICSGLVPAVNRFVPVAFREPLG